MRKPAATPRTPTTAAIRSIPTRALVGRLSMYTAAITSPAAKCPIVVTASTDITQRWTAPMLIPWVDRGRGLAGSIK